MGVTYDLEKAYLGPKNERGIRGVGCSNLVNTFTNYNVNITLYYIITNCWIIFSLFLCTCTDLAVLRLRTYTYTDPHTR